MSTAPTLPWLPAWLYPANLLTELRLVATPVLALAVAQGHFYWALGLFIAASISDGLDGWLARRLHQQSSLGRYLDPLADKLLLCTMFVSLAFATQLPWALTILVFVRDGCILLAALAVYLATGFHDFQPIWWGKANTTAELGTVGFAILSAIANSRVVAGIEVFGQFSVVLLSLISGIQYAFTCATRYHLRQGN